KKTLLGVKLGEPQHAFHGRFQLAELLVHRDRLYREALRGIGVANALERFCGFIVLADARIEVADRVHHGQVFGIVLENFFVLRDGVLELALLNELLRSTENLLLVEPETKRHRIADSGLRTFPALGETNPSKRASSDQSRRQTTRT